MSERIDHSRRRMCQAACGASALVVLSACGGGKTASCSVGSPGAGDTSLAIGEVRFIEQLSVFICRDEKGYYAMGSQCTHVGTELDVDATAGAGFTCPLHHSTFDFDGHVTTGPATLDLPHYELCTTDSGLLIVDQTKLVTSDTRLVV